MSYTPFFNTYEAERKSFVFCIEELGGAEFGLYREPKEGFNEDSSSGIHSGSFDEMEALIESWFTEGRIDEMMREKLKSQLWTVLRDGQWVNVDFSSWYADADEDEEYEDEEYED